MAISEEVRIQENIKKLTPLSVDQLIQLRSVGNCVYRRKPEVVKPLR